MHFFGVDIEITQFEIDLDDAYAYLLQLWQIFYAIFVATFCFDPSFANEELAKANKADRFWIMRLILCLCAGNPNAQDKRGETILSVAVQRNNTASIRVLLYHGANPNVPSRDGFVPLHLAIVNGSKPITLELLRAGANPFLPGGQGFTPIHTAASGGRYGLAEILLNPKINGMIEEEIKRGINAVTDHGQTALHLCAHEGQISCMTLLIRKGAQINVRDKKGRSPLDLAISRRHLNCIQLLMRVGAIKKKTYPNTTIPSIQQELQKWPQLPSLTTLCAIKVHFPPNQAYYYHQSDLEAEHLENNDNNNDNEIHYTRNLARLPKELLEFVNAIL